MVHSDEIVNKRVVRDDPTAVNGRELTKTIIDREVLRYVPAQIELHQIFLIVVVSEARDQILITQRNARI